METDIVVKRVYEPPAAGDGFRVLVDRLWPRGMTKDRVGAELWIKQVAPSTDLRKWFRHERPKWEEFRRRYFLELDDNAEAVGTLLRASRETRVTLLYSAKDDERNHAVALRDYLVHRARQSVG